MKITYFKKIFLILLMISGAIQGAYGQEEIDEEALKKGTLHSKYKWVFGIGVNAIDFFPFNTDGNGNSGGFLNELTNAKDHWNIGGPKLHATRQVWKGLSVEGAFSYNTVKRFGKTRTEKEAYMAVDVNAQYAFLEPTSKFNIALSVGGGYAFVYNSGGTLNVGGNLNWWFTEKFGLNVQGMMKYNSPDYSLAPHMYYAFSFVYRPNGDGLFYGRRFRWRNGI